MQQRFIVYKASAGSGKTFTLAVEYLALLLSQAGGDGFRHILAVTFTNMATAEMKGRILEYLYLIARGHDGKICREVAKHMDTDRPLGEAEMQERAQRCLTAILHDYTYFRVETIDSFLQSVLRNMAHELGLNANLRVELDDKQLIGTAVDQIIDNLRDDRNDKVKGWIQKLLSAQLDAGSAWDVASTVKAFATCIFDEAFLNRKAEERHALRSEETLNRFLQSMREAQAEAEHAVTESVGQALAAWQESDLSVSYSSDYEKMMQRMSRMEPMKMSERIRTALYTDSATMLKKADAQRTDEAERLAAMLREVCDGYTHWYRIWLSARLAIHDIDQLRLLGLLEDTADAVAEENNQFALSKTPSLLSQLIGRDDAPFVFEKAGTTFHHVMIDEFQDTSQMQWSNFRVLLLENLSTQGHDMVVGDIKQSIYRWRNGDWRILQHMEHDSDLPVRPKVLKLDTNYRSEQRIVTFNNNFFAAAAQALDAIDRHDPSICDLYADVAQRCTKPKEMGFVQARLFLNAASNEENYWRQMALEMAGRIDELNRMGVASSQIAILVREKNDGAELIRQFRTVAPHIMLVSNESYLLEASTCVQLIIAAIRVLADPANRIAEAYLRKYDCPVLDDTQKDQLKTEPLYMMCESLHRLLHLERFEGQEAYVMAFFDEVQNFSRNTSADLNAFLTAWDDSLHKVSVPCGNIAGVQVITIHKSKGLEFKVVIYPDAITDLSEKTKKNEPAEVWVDPMELGFEPIPHLQKVLFRLDKKSEMMGEAAFRMFQDEEESNRLDNLNLLYVAFTRAVQRLYVIAAQGKNGKPNLIREFLETRIINKVAENEDGILYRFGNDNFTNPDTHPVNENGKADAMDSFSSNWFEKISIDPEPSMFWISPDDPMQPRQRGNLVHQVFSKIQTLDDIDTAFQPFLLDGTINRENADMLKDKLQQMASHPDVSAAFSAKAKVKNECDILSNGEILRPDRYAELPDVIYLIDYKTGKKEKKHQIQLKNYIFALQGMVEKEIRAYLVYLSDPIEVEKVVMDTLF